MGKYHASISHLLTYKEVIFFGIYFSVFFSPFTLRTPTLTISCSPAQLHYVMRKPLCRNLCALLQRKSFVKCHSCLIILTLRSKELTNAFTTCLSYDVFS